MEFRDLKKQYSVLKPKIDKSISDVLISANYIHGTQVEILEEKLAEYVGVKHCITCANGTDALQLALLAWGIGNEDIVFVPDFTFFSSGEVVAAVGAIPVFIDVEWDTCNIDTTSLERMIQRVLGEGKKPRAIIAVDLFGQPANYGEIRQIAHKYDLLVLEDGAQGFGSSIYQKKACSFGDISTTSFFPAKPLGCYGDGGAIFTDNDEWAELIRSYCVHGKGASKYDNIRIGMNSRLDTIQAAILLAKFDHFANWEIGRMQEVAEWYNEALKNVVELPVIRSGVESSWAQYTIKLDNSDVRDRVLRNLKQARIPCAVYYQKAMHCQKAFNVQMYSDSDYEITIQLCERVLSLPFHPYLEKAETELVSREIISFLG